MEDRQDAPLAPAVEFLLRERLTGRPLPKEAEGIAALWRDEVNARGADTLDKLVEQLHDQEQFAKTIQDLIRDLTKGDEAGEDQGEQDQESEEESDQNNQENSAEDGESGEETEGATMEEMEAGDSEDMEGEETNVSVDADVDMDAEDNPEDSDDGTKPLRPNFRDGDDKERFQYKAFTTANDEVAQAPDLCDPEELARLRAYLDHQLESLQGRGLQARQQAAAPPDGAAEPVLVV